MRSTLTNTPARCSFKDHSFAVNFQSQTTQFPQQRATVGHPLNNKTQPQFKQPAFARDKSANKQDDSTTVKHRKTNDKEISASPNLTKSSLSLKTKFLVATPVKFDGIRQKGSTTQEIPGSKILHSHLLPELKEQKKGSCERQLSYLTPNNKKFELRKFYENQIQGNVYSNKNAFDRKNGGEIQTKEVSAKRLVKEVREEIARIRQDHEKKSLSFIINFAKPIFQQIQTFKNSIAAKKCLKEAHAKNWKQKMRFQVDFLEKKTCQSGLLTLVAISTEQLRNAFAKLRNS